MIYNLNIVLDTRSQNHVIWQMEPERNRKLGSIQILFKQTVFSTLLIGFWFISRRFFQMTFMAYVKHDKNVVCQVWSFEKSISTLICRFQTQSIPIYFIPLDLGMTHNSWVMQNFCFKTLKVIWKSNLSLFDTKNTKTMILKWTTFFG